MCDLRPKTFVSSADGPGAVGARLVEHVRKLVSAFSEIKSEDTAIDVIKWLLGMLSELWMSKTR